ncbi:exodeoxyribonuclease VII small subunit [Sinomonas mesophila]|uniref:exodeoxyribonuclease VII small subunit n=1 Tax=Sinomonas mesophila TaxID=1531955 RepID=UPI00098533C8|nr:exodeoxyribonuclease VII small subunit [Sinomonas mesophila]
MAEAPESRPARTEDLDGLSYEDAREQLVAVVSRLEAGGVSLEESLALWERGEALAQRCEDWLEGARRRLDAAREQPANAGPAGSGGNAMAGNGHGAPGGGQGSGTDRP